MTIIVSNTIVFDNILMKTKPKIPLKTAVYISSYVVDYNRFIISLFYNNFKSCILIILYL